MNIEIANRLVKLRKENGYTQDSLAEALGLSRQAVSKWERAEASPDTDNLILLARLYNISLDELLDTNDTNEEIIEDQIVKKIIDKSEQKFTYDKEEGYLYKTEDDWYKISIKDNNMKVKYDNNQIEMSVSSIIDRKHNFSVIDSVVTSTTIVLITIAYFIIGFTTEKGFANFYWLFVAIPCFTTIPDMIYKRKISKFCYPCLVTSIFLALGTFFDLWYIAWVVFVTIPLFYTIFELVDSRHKVKIRKYMYKAAVAYKMLQNKKAD